MKTQKIKRVFSIKAAAFLLVAAVLLAISACGGKSAGYIDRKQATQAILDYKQNGELKSITFKTVDGMAVYTGTMIVGQEEFPFMLDAETGIVISFGAQDAQSTLASGEAGRSAESSSSSKAGTPAGYIGQDAAEAVAMGLYPAATHVNTGLTTYGDVVAYVITMDNGGRDIDIYIEARTGDVIDPNASASDSLAQ